MLNNLLDLDLLPIGKPVVSLLRHAERPVIAAGELGNELGLTRAGELSCHLLANNLHHHLIKVYSSPLKRCVQTAEILASSAKHPAVTTSHFLGDPGIFICDPAATKNHFLYHSVASIAQHLLEEKANPPGFCHSTPEAVLKLIGFMLSVTTCPGMNLFITHDSILSVVLGYLFKEIPLETLWPNYLEGLLLWHSDHLLHAVYRGIYKQSPLCL